MRRARHGRRPRAWATCPLTQAGFVRVSSNSRVVPEARTPGEALALLKRMTALRGHHFWIDDVELARSTFVEPARILGYRQVTDAHPVALALRHRGRLATFDRSIEAVIPAATKPSDALVVLS